MANLYKKGMSLVELLIVFAVMSIIFLIVMPQFSKIRESAVLKTTVGDTMSAINKAKNNTLSSLNSSEYGVHFQSDRVIIFKGKIFSVGALGNETININTPATISNVTLGGVSGTSGDVYFNRILGVPSTTGSITISTSSFSKIITIYPTGGVSSN